MTAKIIIHFYLLRPREDFSPLNITINFGGTRIRMLTGITVRSAHWHTQRERLKSSATHATAINSQLDRISTELSNAYFMALGKNVVPGKAYITQKLKDIIKPDQADRQQDRDMLYYLQLFIDQREASQKFKPRTIKPYKTLKQQLETFKKNQHVKISFDNMTLDFIEQFTLFLNTDKKIHNNNNTASKKIRNLKTFLHWCLAEGITHETCWIKEFRTNNYESDTVALLPEELEALERYEPRTEAMANVKTLFLILIYTGMRYSDLSNLKPENIDLKQEIIKIYTIKSPKALIIPIHSRLKTILKRTGLKFHVISNDTFNWDLKRLCQFAGITDPVQVTKYYGTERQDVTVPKYQLVSSHCGRRTFITLSLKKGLLPETVMKISGHKSRAAFQKYVRIAQNEAVRAVKEAWE